MIDFSRNYTENEFYDTFETCVACGKKCDIASIAGDWGVENYMITCMTCTFYVLRIGEADCGHIVAGWIINPLCIMIDYTGAYVRTVSVPRNEAMTASIKTLSEGPLVDIKEIADIAEKYRLLA